MLVLIDQFIGTASGIDTEVSIFFNTVTGAVTTTPMTPPVSFESFNPPRFENEPLYQKCFDADSYEVFKSLSNPYYTKVIVADSPLCGVIPPQCDLAIQTLKTDETAQGANDGSISVSATSSFANPRISIDNITFYPTPYTFGPLAPGPYTIYAKDDNDCTKTQDLTIGSFTNPVVGNGAGLPQVEILPGLISRWNAAFNPIVFSFQNTPDPTKKNFRIEIEITTIFGTISGFWSPNPQGFTRADIAAYLQTVVNARDKFDYSVLNWRDLDRAASFTIRYREVWDAGASNWYYTPQPFYVTWSAMQLQDLYGGNMAEYVPMIAGGVVAPTEWDYTLTQTATPDYIDANLQIKANAVAVKTVFTDESGNFTIPVGQSFSIEAFVNDATAATGAKLALYIYKNGNLVFKSVIPNVPGASLLYTGVADYGATYSVTAAGLIAGDTNYVNIPDSTTPIPTGANLAKFLTLYKEPTVTVGLPWDVSFIFSEYLIDKVVKMRTTSLDINRQPISGGVVNGFLLNNDGGYILNTDLSRLIIQQGALPPVANDGILEQLGINRLMLSGGPAAGVEYFTIQLYVGDDNAPEYVTQPLTLKINKPCNDPFIYLKWLNTLGGWDYYRFGHDQILQLATADGTVIDRNVFDWQNDDTIADTIRKSGARRVTIGAQVSELKRSGIEGLHLSTKIQVLTSANPVKWQTVRIPSGTFDTGRRRNNYLEYRFTIVYPEINIQVNGSAPQQLTGQVTPA